MVHIPIGDMNDDVATGMDNDDDLDDNATGDMDNDDHVYIDMTVDVDDHVAFMIHF